MVPLIIIAIILFLLGVIKVLSSESKHGIKSKEFVWGWILIALASATTLLAFDQKLFSFPSEAITDPSELTELAEWLIVCAIFASILNAGGKKKTAH